jgi:hypothetical protein
LPEALAALDSVEKKKKCMRYKDTEHFVGDLVRLLNFRYADVCSRMLSYALVC